MRRAVMSLCLATLMPLTACGDDSAGSDASSDDSPTPVTNADLAGRTFVSTSVTGFELIDGTEIRISFEEDHLSASAGCNTVGGAYTVENDLLSVSEPSATLMACDPQLMTQDDQLIGFLTDDPAISLSDEVLTLTGADVTVEMQEESGDANAVEATVTSIIDGKVDYSINGDGLTVSKDAQALEYRAG